MNPTRPTIRSSLTAILLSLVATGAAAQGYLVPGTAGPTTALATGLVVQAGEPLSVDARGLIQWRPTAAGWAPAAGDPTAGGSTGLWLPTAPRGALLGRIGTVVFPLGAHWQGGAPASGPLELGVNDDLHADNAGGFDVVVQRHAEHVGRATPATYGTPTIGLDGIPGIGQTTVLRAGGLRPGDVGFLVLGFPFPEPLPIPGAPAGAELRVWVALSDAQPADPSGGFGSPLPLPPVRALVGIELAAQVFTVDPLLPAALPLAHSDTLLFPIVEDPAGLRIPGGIDLLETRAGLVDLALPPDFLAPGSAPFQGRVPLAGAALGTADRFELGTTDTIVRRLHGDPRVLGSTPGSDVTVPIEIHELSLQSVQPIVVTIQGQPQRIRVELHADPLRSAAGTMTLTRGSATGGQARCTVELAPVLVLTNLDAPSLPPRTLALPPRTMATAGPGAWSVPDPSTPDGSAFFATATLRTAVRIDALSLQGAGLGLDLRAPRLDPTRPQATVHPSAQVDPTARLGRGATVEAGAAVGAGAVVGPQAVVGANGFVGARAVVGAGSRLLGGCTIEPGAEIAEGTLLGSSVRIGAGARIGVGCQLLDGVDVGDHAVIGHDSVLAANVGVGSRTVVGAAVTIGQGATLLDGLFIADTAQITAGTVQNEDLVPCSVAVGGVSVLAGQVGRNAGGIAFGSVPALGDGVVGYEKDEKESAQTIDPNNLPPELRDLARDVDAAGVWRNPYTETFRCVQFADGLERALETRGYDATFTLVKRWIPNPRYTPTNGEPQGEWDRVGHAMTDVHVGGRIVWVEPQLNSGQGAIRNAWGAQNLDGDGDGRVEYVYGKRTNELTDGNLSIEVYPSKAAAEKAGHRL
ncbi:MAG: hypothetical protein IPM29_15315 [Planctomycetes bacterium]|nr:hypothetical protein [Planctomycetota bacterium]